MKTSALRAEAAQFALLRRLAPSLRHRLMGSLHPAGLLAELANRRLATEPPDVLNARESLAKVQSQVRAATAASTAVLAWINGEEARCVGLQEGIEECIALLRTDFEMRGVTIHAQLADTDSVVSRRALRTVLAAALFAIVDLSHATRIELRTVIEADAADLCIEAHAMQAARNPDLAGEDRPLTWDDVEALARLEDVGILRIRRPLVIQCRFRPTRTERSGASPLGAALVHGG